MGFFDDWVSGILATAPQSNPAMRELHKLHRLWLPTAELHTAYYGTTAENTWIWPDSEDQPHVYCDQEWTFVREVKAGRHTTHLVTKTGVPSYEAFYRAAQGAGGRLAIGKDTKILTTRQPSVPPKPRMPAMVRGDLRDFI
jgi:hypothetical protein